MAGEKLSIDSASIALQVVLNVLEMKSIKFCLYNYGLPAVRIELTTTGLQDQRSATEPSRLICLIIYS